MSQPSHAVIVPPGEGVRFGNVEFLALSEHTPRLNVSVITMAPGRDGPEAHVHQDEDDVFYVLEGELTFDVGHGDVAAPAGTFVLVPPGVEHTHQELVDQERLAGQDGCSLVVEQIGIFVAE